jgi:hypothetical protein
VRAARNGDVFLDRIQGSGGICPDSSGRNFVAAGVTRHRNFARLANGAVERGFSASKTRAPCRGEDEEPSANRKLLIAGSCDHVRRCQ